MTKKKVLVCGSTGFIGRNIAEFLANNSEYEVYGSYFNSPPLENPKTTPLKADLRNAHEVDNIIKGKDIVIQAAATTSGSRDIISRPYIHVTDNALMNSLIFRSAFDNNVPHLVFFSCSVMYNPSDKPVKEVDFDASKEMVPSYFGVGWTKVYLEKMAEFFANLGRTKFTVIRHSNIYGPYDKFDLEKSHVFGATLTKVMNSDGKVVVWGTGEEGRDLLYVSDLVSFVDASLKNQDEKFGIFNVGSGEAIPIRGLVEKIISHSGKNLKMVFDSSKPSIKTHLSLDCSRARERFGWNPKVSLDEGIQRTMEWYRQNYKTK